MNVNGAVYDDFHPHGPGSERRPGWNAEGLRIATHVNGTLNNDADQDDSWTLEVAIPFKAYRRSLPNVFPKPGDVWRLNLNRCGGKTNEQFSQSVAGNRKRAAVSYAARFRHCHFSAEKMPFSKLRQEVSRNNFDSRLQPLLPSKVAHEKRPICESCRSPFFQMVHFASSRCSSSWTSGCIQHTEIDFGAYVREVAAAEAGRDVTTIDNATRLGELGFQEADLGRLAKRLERGTSEKITESDLKGLRPNGSWKDIRLYDIGCFVGRKVLDSREAASASGIKSRNETRPTSDGST